MQASRTWTEPTGTLGGLVAEARQRAAALRDREAELAAAAVPVAPSLVAALRGETVGVIAEIKRRSPSRGWINRSLPAAEQARSYERGGAAAVSVLTEPNHFGGSANDLSDVRAALRIPILKKDFHVEPVQLLEARALGASAALLIVRALAPAALKKMIDFGRVLPIELLVEVRDEDELRRALDEGATLIGVNNRDLETLAIDPATCERVLGSVPPNVVAVAESGVVTRTDVVRLARSGADAVLVGSAVSGAADPGSAVRALTGVGRETRGR